MSFGRFDFPQDPDTLNISVSQITYEIVVSGENGGSVDLPNPLSENGSWNGSPPISVEDYLSLYEDFAKSVAAAINANKPVGSTVTLRRSYSGGAGQYTFDTVTY